jgi:hypothetical protein
MIGLSTPGLDCPVSDSSFFQVKPELWFESSLVRSGGPPMYSRGAASSRIKPSISDARSSISDL